MAIITEIIYGFLEFQILFLVLVLFTGCVFYILAIVTTVLMYKKKKKFVWLSVIISTILGFLVFFLPLLFDSSPNLSLQKWIIDIIVVLLTLIFHSTILVSLTIFTMFAITKFKSRKHSQETRIP